MIATSSPQEAKSDIMKDLIKIKSECSSIVQNQTFWATLSTYNNGWKEDFDLEAAKLKAEQNRVLSNSITSEILKLKEIELKEKTIQKWDGKYPKVIGGESDMLLDIGEQ